MTKTDKAKAEPKKRAVKEAQQKIQPPPLDPSLYNAFVAGIKLKRIELAEVTARSSVTALPEVKLKVSQKFGVTCPVRQEDRFVAQAQLQLGFQTSEGEELGMILCAYRLEYVSGVPLTDELFDEFARRNVPLNAWPFLRETTMNLTQRFGWSGFVLPPLMTTAGPLPKPAATQEKANLPTKKAGAKKSKASSP